MNVKLIEYIKSIIESEPYDILADDETSVTESSFELVNSRDSEYDRYIGSVNIFIAASLLCNEIYKGKYISALNNDELDEFNKQWSFLINFLKTEKFIRDIASVARTKIKLVNKTESPDTGT